MFAIYLGPYFLMLSGIVTNPAIVFALWILMGLGMAGIGLSVMHDANHGAYSEKKWVNKLMSYSMNLIGANSQIWRMQHNQLHHTYTNIEGMDDDINTPGILRFSPNAKLHWVHKYQYIYVWFLYGLATLSWTTTKEFGQAIRYNNLGLIKSKAEFRQLFSRLVLIKVLYFTYTLVIPLIFFPYSALLIAMSFIAMHFVAGFIISLIFQTAHVMPDCSYPLPAESGNIDNTWAIHELQTTSNYAPTSRIFSWFIGGLNFQVEHHLFPKICHIHYKGISKIVASTAKEFNVPYNTQRTFLSAIWTHTKMLHSLGKPDVKYA
ncbi:MAG: acyl-CoA desaturase [Bacteroidia bacterium]|nr:acyl-CoA desaturase [Bacteroidia bacterium]